MDNQSIRCMCILRIYMSKSSDFLFPRVFKPQDFLFFLIKFKGIGKVSGFLTQVRGVMHAKEARFHIPHLETDEKEPALCIQPINPLRRITMFPTALLTPYNPKSCSRVFGSQAERLRP